MPPLDRAEVRMIPGLLWELAGSAWQMRRELARFFGISVRLGWLMARDAWDERGRA